MSKGVVYVFILVQYYRCTSLMNNCQNNRVITTVFVHKGITANDKYFAMQMKPQLRPCNSCHICLAAIKCRSLLAAVAGCTIRSYGKVGPVNTLISTNTRKIMSVLYLNFADAVCHCSFKVAAVACPCGY